MTHGSKTNTSNLNKKISFQYISLYVKFTHFINVKYFNSTISMYYMFSIQVTNYISNYIWCLSYQFFSCFTPPRWSLCRRYASYWNAFLFYTCLSSILFTGGSASVHAGIPPGEQTPPQSRHPPQEQTPPSPPRTDTPREQTPPPRKQTPAYGLRADGTHPTGMHSFYD